MPLFRLSSWNRPASAETASFTFLDPGLLIDDELELLAPRGRWVDAALASCLDPLSVADDPTLARTTRQQLIDFILTCPDGHQRADSAAAILPGYHFWMHSAMHTGHPIVGGISFRVGQTYDTVMFYGHIGYHVYPFARGHHYAERACRLLVPLARRHGINPLWITCNTENIASRRTCERLGASLIEVVPLPTDHPLYARGDRNKCRYRLDL